MLDPFSLGVGIVLGIALILGLKRYAFSGEDSMFPFDETSELDKPEQLEAAAMQLRQRRAERMARGGYDN